MKLKQYTHKQLSDWMRENNVSVVKLALKMNLSPVQINHILNLKRGMSKQSLKKLHEITNIPIEQLLYPEDFKINPKEKEVA